MFNPSRSSTATRPLVQHKAKAQMESVGSRADAVRLALLLTYITLGWMTIEGAASLLLGAVAKIGMSILAAYKLKVAARLSSRALRADAIESITCGYLSIVLMIGLAATWLLGWWWLDSVAALALIPFLIREARAAITGESCSACSDTSLRTGIRDEKGGG